MMEAVRTSEPSVNIFLTTRQYIPEDSILHTRRHVNLKSHLPITFAGRIQIAEGKGRALLLRNRSEGGCTTCNRVKCTHWVFAAEKENPFTEPSATEYWQPSEAGVLLQPHFGNHSRLKYRQDTEMD
jgi:hypothetical protein